MTSKLPAAMPFLGATLAVAGIAGFIEASANIPGRECPGSRIRCFSGQTVPAGLSFTAYDLLRIASWALVIFGALLVLTGLMRLWHTEAR
jgi:hypothetical protein